MALKWKNKSEKRELRNGRRELSTDRTWSFQNQLMPAVPHCPEGNLKVI